MQNPFKQPEVIWQISFELKYKNIPSFETIFEEDTLAICSHEITSETVEAMDDDIWMLELYFDQPISKEILPNHLLDLLDIDSIKIEQVEDKDWLLEAANSLGDIKTEKFHIIRKEGEYDPSLIPIIINITRAFGTGEHATTIGCVEALEQYADKKCDHILDIGTGTGILAIAAKKLWPTAYVVGTDIDPVSIEVAAKHAKLNEVDIEFLETTDPIGKFDIILANILAGPLISMAANITQMLNQDGIIILSGFLENQLDGILSEYAKYNISPLSIIHKNRWIIVVLV